eukprot:6178309-Pleurochrysis_carterae.AAC.1
MTGENIHIRSPAHATMSAHSRSCTRDRARARRAAADAHTHKRGPVGCESAFSAAHARCLRMWREEA